MLLSHKEVKLLRTVLTGWLQVDSGWSPPLFSKEELDTLKRLSRNMAEWVPDEKTVQRLLDTAEEIYEPDQGQDYDLSFDGPDSTYLSEADDGAWVSCWAWVTYEAAGLVAEEEEGKDYG